jgi:hypothetical protein
MNAAICQEASIHAGTTSDFEYAISRVKGLLKFLPDGSTLGEPDARGREDFIVAVGDSIEWS